MSSKHTLYVCEIVFLRAEHVPIGDINDFSCDPYIHASLEVPNVHPDYPHPPLSYRTPTIRRTLNPTFNSRWIVCGIPDSGFTLSLRLLDEDHDGDDRLGKTVVHLPDPMSGQLLEMGWNTGEVEYKVEKKKGSIRAYTATYLAAMITRGRISHRARVWVSARVLRKAENQKDRRIFTVGPPKYVRHFSPLIGHLVSGGTSANEPYAKGNNKPLSASTFVANRIQLAGPPPASLRHRYVGYAPFIKSLFKRSGIRGKILNFALRRQYNIIYGYDKSTVYGVAGEGDIKTKSSKSHITRKTRDRSLENGDAQHNSAHDQLSTKGGTDPQALSRLFLSMTSHGTAGRLFTYVITLDSEWRFTETGEEFSVDLLSKHSMHANIAKEIAYSGEFFVRRIQQGRNGSLGLEGGKDHGDDEGSVAENLADYELVIDNDSGTYRPKKELLPKLQEWLRQKENLGALGRVTAMDGFDQTLQKWKEERQEEKRRAKGLKPRPKKDGGKGKEKSTKNVGQSKEDGLEEMAIPKKKGFPSLDSGRSGSVAGSVSSSDLEDVLREDAKRARENDDHDEPARREEGEME